MANKTIPDVLENIQASFRKNVESVRELMNFDKVVIALPIQHLTALVEKLKKVHAIGSPAHTAEGTLRQLENIRDNRSLNSQYQKMYNSCLVLLVSYFSSAIEDVFQECLTLKIKEGRDHGLGKEEIKTTLADLKEVHFNIQDHLGELIALKNDFSFQDMKSVAKAFHTYFRFEIKKEKEVNNIILAQGCRHVIAHSDGLVNKKLTRQVSAAEPRDIKTNLVIDEPIQFSPEELEVVISSMQTYLSKLAGKILEEENRAKDTP